MVRRYRGTLRAVVPAFSSVGLRSGRHGAPSGTASFASAACTWGAVARPPVNLRRNVRPPRTAPISTAGPAARKVQDSAAAAAYARDDSAGSSYWPGAGRSSSAISFFGGLGPSGRADDEAIRTAFDQPASIAASTSRHGQPTGLFLHPLLTSPNALASVTQQTLVHAHHLVDRIASVTPSFQPSFPSSPFTTDSGSPYQHARRIRMVPKLLDRLSDTICLVIDMCELVRNVHPEEEWVRQADNSYEVLGSFMNGLNTHTGLYEVGGRCETTSAESPDARVLRLSGYAARRRTTHLWPDPKFSSWRPSSGTLKSRASTCPRPRARRLSSSATRFRSSGGNSSATLPRRPCRAKTRYPRPT